MGGPCEIVDVIFTGSCYGISHGNIPSSKIALYFILLILPDIADLVLSILGFSKGALSYYIIRFISQSFFIFFNITVLGFMSYHNKDGIDGMIPGIPFCIMFILILISEILSVIFYAIYYNDIFFYARLGFYIHYIYLIILILIICFKKE